MKGYSLTGEEAQIIDLYRGLNDKGKSELLIIAKTFKATDTFSDPVLDRLPENLRREMEILEKKWAAYIGKEDF